MNSLLRPLITSMAILAAMPGYAQEKVVLWDLLGGGDGILFKGLIEKFNEEHKGKIEIERTSLEWGTPYYTKVQTSAAVGQGPDLAIYHLSRMQSAVASNTLKPLDLNALEAVGLKDSDFPATALDAATIDGKRYAVPFDVHGLVLYYNKSVLKLIDGLDAEGKPAGIDTIEGWHALLEKVKAAGKNGVAMDAAKGDIRPVYTIFGQLGGQLLTDGKFLEGDNLDKMTKAVDEVGSWVSKGWMPAYVDYTTMVSTFLGGETAFNLNGGWELPTMEAEVAKGGGFDYGMMPVPTWFGTPANWADSHSFAIPNNVGVTSSPEKQAAVIEVVKWMNQNSLDWAKAGHIPAYLPVRESAEFKALQPQSNYADVVAERAFYLPKSAVTGAGSAMETEWASSVAGAVNGEGGAKEGLEQFRDTMNGM